MRPSPRPATDPTSQYHLMAEDLRLLAALHGAEPSAELISALKAGRVEEILNVPPRGALGLETLDFFERALADTPTDKAAIDEIAADFAAIYLTHAHRVSPAESPWIDPEGLTSQEPMFAMRDWYRHYGLEVADWRMRPDDHMVNQLVFVAHLLESSNPHAAADAARFLDGHLLRWLPAFAEGVLARCWTPYWAGLARLTDVWLDSLRETLAETTGVARVVLEPIEEEKRRRRAAAVLGESCASPTPVTDAPPGW